MAAKTAAQTTIDNTDEPMQPAGDKPAKKRPHAPEVSFGVIEIDESEFVEKDTQKTGRGQTPYMKQLTDYIVERYTTGKPGALECDKSSDVVAALETKIRSAANYANVGIRFGAYHASSNDGMVIVTFKVVAKVARPRKPKTETA